MHSHILPILTVGVLLPYLGFSAEPPAEELTPTVVTGSSDKDLEVERLESAVPQVGLTGEQLTSQAALQLGDAIKYMPGVYLSGNINENDDLQLRGLPKQYSRIQIGGVQFSDGAGESREFQMNRLPKNIFKSATFVRNPTAEYESDGLGGRLALETIDIPKEFMGELQLGFGARNSETPLWNNNVMVGGMVNDWFGLLAAANYNIDPTLKIKVTKDYLDDGSFEKASERYEDTTVDTYGAFVDAGIFYEQGETHFKPLFLRRETKKHSQKETIDFTKNDLKNESFDNDTENRVDETSGFTATNLHKWSDWATQDTKFSYYRSFQNMPSSIGDSFKEDGGVLAYDGQELERFYGIDRTLEFQTKTTLDLNTKMAQTLKFGVMARTKDRDADRHYQESDELGNITDLTTDADRYFLTEDYVAGFVQDQIWLTDKFSVLPGLRVEHVQLKSRDGGGVSDSRSMTDFNPTLHFLYKPKETVSYHLAFSRTVNRPQFDQLSPYRRIDDDDEVVETGNPDLDPARSWNIDLGVEWDGGPIFLGANIFYKEVTDVIQNERIGVENVSGTDYALYQSRNVGDGSLIGLELDQRFRFSDTNISSLHGLELWANQTFISSDIDFKNGNSGSFEEQPEFIANFGIDYIIAGTKTKLSLTANYVSDFAWNESDGTEISYASEWIVNLAARQKISENLEAFVEVVNVFDEERFEKELKTNGESRDEFITGGRSVLAGLKYTF